MSIKNLIGDRRALAGGVGLLGAYGVMIAAGATGTVGFFAAAAVVVGVGELVVHRFSGALPLLTRLRVTPIYRHLGRDAATLLFLSQLAAVPAGTKVVVALLLGAVWAASLGAGAVGVVIGRTLTLPVLTRNIDLSGLPLSETLSPTVRRITNGDLRYLNAFLVPAVVLTALLDRSEIVLLTAAAVAAAAVIAALALLPMLYRAWRAPDRETVLAAIRAQLRPEPTVLLHFAGSGRDAYQVNMWLRSVEALDQPALVLLRERSCLQAMAPTSLPVVYIPNPIDVMNFGFDSVRVALHPSNVGKNIHILREPDMKHVFVGHGDSDKIASVNPYSKVYDEVWVAGRAGRDRYAQADVGVRDEDIVEVGRPQLAGLATTGSGPDTPFTVLYAPTWEGWVEDPHATSLLLLGEKIIAGLLAVSPALRVWYKPHPLTGKRSQAAAATHRRLAQLVTGAGGRVGSRAAADLPALGHHVFDGPEPALYDCFNQSDLLISDVSSVVSDWIATRKPYAVGNTRDLPDDEYRRLYPTAGAAYLLSSSGAELAAVVAACRDGGDPKAADRAALKEYLLGPDEPTSAQRFQAEVTRLCASRRSPAVRQPV